MKINASNPKCRSNNTKKYFAALLATALGGVSIANADPGHSPPIPSEIPPPSDKFVNFSVNSLTYLYGFNWNTPFAPNHARDIITIESFNDNKIGDLFFFVDIANLTTLNRGNPKSGIDYYGEFDPRLSFSKIFGKSCKYGIIKDFFFYSGCLELGSSGSLDNVNRKFGTQIDTSHFAQLHGMAVDIDIPGFRVAQINAYWRKDSSASGSTWQITPVWDIPFKISGSEFVFKGFADFSGRQGKLSSIIHTSPQLMMDVGDKVFNKKGVFFIGTEVDIWHNEFGHK